VMVQLVGVTLTLRRDIIESRCYLGNQTQQQVRRYLESRSYLGD
jgi:hypothetical protein